MMAVTAAKPITTFRVLTMAVNLSRLTTGTMDSNDGHEKTSKASIILQFNQLEASPESERQDRLGAAVPEAFTLQTALLLGTISDEGKTLLQAWMDYITQLKAMDFTQVTDSASLDGIQWPAAPE